jgi:hypothetical protein
MTYKEVVEFMAERQAAGLTKDANPETKKFLEKKVMEWEGLRQRGYLHDVIKRVDDCDIEADIFEETMKLIEKKLGGVR